MRSLSSCPRSWSVAAALLLTAACGGVTSSPDDGPDAGVAAPDGPVVPDAVTITTTPADGTAGVARDAVFVFRFSEPMDPAATIAAYASVELPASAVTFAWNDAGDTLTIAPVQPLPYASGDASVGPLGFAMRITTAARSRAGHAPAADARLGFTTLRRIVARPARVDALSGRVNETGFTKPGSLVVGDYESKTAVASFLTFSLADVPSGAAIEAAYLSVPETSVNGTPDADLGALVAQHVLFSTLDASTYGVELLASTPNQTTFARSMGPTYLRGTSIAGFVQDDLANRAARGDLSQLRILYTRRTDNDGISDHVTLAYATAVLEVSYLAE